SLAAGARVDRAGGSQPRRPGAALAVRDGLRPAAAFAPLDRPPLAGRRNGVLERPWDIGPLAAARRAAPARPPRQDDVGAAPAARHPLAARILASPARR